MFVEIEFVVAENVTFHYHATQHIIKNTIKIRW